MHCCGRLEGRQQWSPVVHACWAGCLPQDTQALKVRYCKMKIRSYRRLLRASLRPEGNGLIPLPSTFLFLPTQSSLIRTCLIDMSRSGAVLVLGILASRTETRTGCRSRGVNPVSRCGIG